MPRKTGINGKVSIAPSGSTTFAEIPNRRKWTFSYKRDKVDVTCQGDSNKQKLNLLADVTGTIDVIGDDTAGTATLLWAAALDGLPRTLKLEPEDGESGYWSGEAVLDFAHDNAHDGALTNSITFEATGDWTWTNAA